MKFKAAYVMEGRWENQILKVLDQLGLEWVEPERGQIHGYVVGEKQALENFLEDLFIPKQNAVPA